MENLVEKGLDVANKLFEERMLGVCPLCGSKLSYYYDNIRYECDNCPSYHHVAIRCNREKGTCYFAYTNFVSDESGGLIAAWKMLIGTFLHWKEKSLGIEEDGSNN